MGQLVSVVMARPIVAMVTDETLAVLQPHVDAYAARLRESVSTVEPAEVWAWGAVLGAFARSLECGDNTIEWSAVAP